jgi:hypothetical protein
MAFHDLQLCEDETKYGINIFEHIILSLNSTIFGVHPDFTDTEIQSHPATRLASKKSGFTSNTVIIKLK